MNKLNLSSLTHCHCNLPVFNSRPSPSISNEVNRDCISSSFITTSNSTKFIRFLESFKNLSQMCIVMPQEAFVTNSCPSLLQTRCGSPRRNCTVEWRRRDEENKVTSMRAFFKLRSITSYLQLHACPPVCLIHMLVGTHDECLVRAPLAGARIATMRMVWGSGRVPGPSAAAWMTHFWGSRSCELALANLH